MLEDAFGRAEEFGGVRGGVGDELVGGCFAGFFGEGMRGGRACLGGSGRDEGRGPGHRDGGEQVSAGEVLHGVRRLIVSCRTFWWDRPPAI